ncbi:MAG: hypothetical protein J7575_06815 [Chloroflexi bacterium]|nr:hypothetical protein [Chloroflexota bacterium]
MKKLWIGIAFLGLTLTVALAALVLTEPLELYAGKRIFHGETATYSYTGEVLEGTGDVLVNVYYLRGGEKAIQAYREANTKRNYALLARKEPKLIYVQVTFVRPIPSAEVSSLVKETGFKVENFLMAGRNSQGGRAWCIDGTGNLDKPFCDDPNLGVMILKGWVETTEQGLGRWMADERVYIIDTVAAEIEILAQKHPDIVAGRELIGPGSMDGKKVIVIGAESPFWELEW